MPAPVLFAFLSLLEGYQKPVSHLPCVAYCNIVVLLICDACTGHGNLIAERDESRATNNKHRYSYTNTEGEVVNQILLEAEVLRQLNAEDVVGAGFFWRRR